MALLSVAIKEDAPFTVERGIFFCINLYKVVATHFGGASQLLEEHVLTLDVINYDVINYLELHPRQCWD